MSPRINFRVWAWVALIQVTAWNALCARSSSEKKLSQTAVRLHTNPQVWIEVLVMGSTSLELTWRLTQKRRPNPWFAWGRGTIVSSSSRGKCRETPPSTDQPTTGVDHGRGQLSPPRTGADRPSHRDRHSANPSKPSLDWSATSATASHNFAQPQDDNARASSMLACIAIFPSRTITTKRP